MKDDGTMGYFVWQDVGGWHVRTRGAATAGTFKGTVRGSRDMDSIKAVPANSEVKATLVENLVTFEIPPSSELRGFDLIAGCKTDQLQFALLIGSNPAPADGIYVGPKGKAVSPVFLQQRAG